MKNLDLSAVNDRLDRVKIRATGNKLYLRATLPLKPGQGKGRKQQDIKTGCDNTPKGLITALGMARKLESQICDQTFDWTNWGIEPPEETAQKSENIETLIQKFEEDFWNRKQKTISRADAYDRSYRHYFKRLPLDEPLTEKVLKEVLLKYPADTKSRETACRAFSALARFAGIEANLIPYKGTYRPGSRAIPTDEQIIEIVDNCDNPAHRWIMGIMAAYGLRNHEIFSLDTSQLANPPHILRVLADTKTGDRIVYPVPADWPARWQLWDIYFPNWKIDGKSNMQRGAKVTKIFRDRKIGFQPYSFRDRYAVRCAEMGIDSTIAAKWMGHSISIHFASYQKYIDMISMDKIWLGKVLGKTETNS